MPESSVTPSTPDLYYGLLSNPPGQYGRATHGASTAFTLRGSHEFLTKAQNLFDSFGGEIENGPLDGSRPRYQERREVIFRAGNNRDSLYFCMAPERARRVLTTYLYAQLVHAKGQWRDRVDDEGDFIERECLNEGALETEAQELATSFYEHEIGLDYRAIPEYVPTAGLVEHGHTLSLGSDDAESSLTINPTYHSSHG